jgi:hypothetical protein
MFVQYKTLIVYHPVECSFLNLSANRSPSTDMPPVLSASHGTIHSTYTSIAAFLSKITAWFSSQGHNIIDATTWLTHLPSRIISRIVQASVETLHWLGYVLLTLAKVLSALVAILLAILLLFAIYHTLKHIWTKHSNRRTCYFTPTLGPGVYRPERVLRPGAWPCYGTMEPTLPGTTISRLSVEEYRGAGWKRTVWHSATQHIY